MIKWLGDRLGEAPLGLIVVWAIIIVVAYIIFGTNTFKP